MYSGHIFCDLTGTFNLKNRVVICNGMLCVFVDVAFGVQCKSYDPMYSLDSAQTGCDQEQRKSVPRAYGPYYQPSRAELQLLLYILGHHCQEHFTGGHEHTIAYVEWQGWDDAIVYRYDYMRPS